MALLLFCTPLVFAMEGAQTNVTIIQQGGGAMGPPGSMPGGHFINQQYCGESNKSVRGA
jgi:hypothetical protein